MTDTGNQSISKYTWMSTGEYVRWLEASCGLTAFNPDGVYSMRVNSKTGYEGLRSRKMKLASVIEGNISLIAGFEREYDINEGAQGIIAVIKENMEHGLDIIRSQLRTIDRIVNLEKKELLGTLLADDEIPF